MSAKGVKGYVGSGAIAPVANKAAAPETRYANAKQAQAAADAREAAYAAAVAAFQKQIAANELPIWPLSPSNRIFPKRAAAAVGSSPLFFFYFFPVSLTSPPGAPIG